MASVLFGSCPVPQSRYDRILLGHGSGGQLTAELLQRLFLPAFGNEAGNGSLLMSALRQ